MKNNILLFLIVLLLHFLNVNAQVQEKSIKIKKEKSLLIIEQLVNNSLNQSNNIEVNKGELTLQKRENNSLKVSKVRHKLTLIQINSKNSNNENQIFQKKPLSFTKGEKKLLIHSPIEPKPISKENVKSLKAMLGIPK